MVVTISCQSSCSCTRIVIATSTWTIHHNDNKTPAFRTCYTSLARFDQIRKREGQFTGYKNGTSQVDRTSSRRTKSGGKDYSTTTHTNKSNRRTRTKHLTPESSFSLKLSSHLSLSPISTDNPVSTTTLTFVASSTNKRNSESGDEGWITAVPPIISSPTRSALCMTCPKYINSTISSFDRSTTSGNRLTVVTSIQQEHAKSNQQEASTIVGSVMGTVAGLALILFSVGFLLLRYSRLRKKQQKQLQCPYIERYGKDSDNSDSNDVEREYCQPSIDYGEDDSECLTQSSPRKSSLKYTILRQDSVFNRFLAETRPRSKSRFTETGSL